MRELRAAGLPYHEEPGVEGAQAERVGKKAVPLESIVESANEREGAGPIEDEKERRRRHQSPRMQSAVESRRDRTESSDQDMDEEEDEAERSSILKDEVKDLLLEDRKLVNKQRTPTLSPRKPRVVRPDTSKL